MLMVQYELLYVLRKCIFTTIKCLINMLWWYFTDYKLNFVNLPSKRNCGFLPNSVNEKKFSNQNLFCCRGEVKKIRRICVKIYAKIYVVL